MFVVRLSDTGQESVYAPRLCALSQPLLTQGWPQGEATQQMTGAWDISPLRYPPLSRV
jgi:hypothetical protein